MEVHDEFEAFEPGSQPHCGENGYGRRVLDEDELQGFEFEHKQCEQLEGLDYYPQQSV